MAAIPPSPESLIAHGDFLRGLARNLLGDEHRAEDMVQQTYVRALSAPPRQGLRSWLTTVVKRLSPRRTSVPTAIGKPSTIAGKRASAATQRNATHQAKLRRRYARRLRIANRTARGSG